MRWLNNKPKLIDLLFALGLMLSILPDFLSYDPSNTGRFALQVANTLLDSALFIAVFVFLKREIAQHRVASERAEKANQLKTEFLQIAAHDLRNPLNAVMQLAALLPPEAQETSEVIRKISQEMKEMIDNLLDAAALDSNTLKIHRSVGDMSETVREVVERNRPQAERKGQKLTLFAPEPCIAAFDPTRIRQVVDNLVSNAVKFSPGDKKISVAVYSTANEIRMEVTDNGPGLTAEDKTKLFERSQRLSARPTGGESSTGLGLANARRLMELHGGRIGAESPVPETGAGSRFWIELPSAG